MCLALVNGRKVRIESCLAFSPLAGWTTHGTLPSLGTVVVEKTARKIMKEESGVGEVAQCLSAPSRGPGFSSHILVEQLTAACNSGSSISMLSSGLLEHWHRLHMPTQRCQCSHNFKGGGWALASSRLSLFSSGSPVPKKNNRQICSAFERVWCL